MNSEIFSITLIIILAAISPGPDFAMVVKNALQSGRGSALFTSLGIFCSLLLHTFYASVGLGLIISKSLLLFGIIKYAGAIYLFYIGLKSLLDRSSIEIKTQYAAVNKKVAQAFMQGLLCNLLNPKAILFILSFFTLLVKPSSSLMTQFGFGFEIALIHLLWFSILSLIITYEPLRFKLGKVQYYISKAMGLALMGFGVRIASLQVI